MTANAVLDEAYQRLHGKGPEFGGDEEGNHGLTNHGPMAVEVMVRRGLDLDVHRWLDRYLGRLTELPGATSPVDEGNWRQALGDGRRIGDWTAYFTRILAEQPWRPVLGAWWPRLLPGIAAGSTHGVIRVGHAVRALRAADAADATDEVAVTELGYGLAFWAARSRPLPRVAAPAGTLAPAEALAAVPRLAHQHGLIAHRLDRLSDLAGWSGALAALRPPADPDGVPDALADLVHAAVLRYAAYGQASPVLLVHTATAPNAVWHILPELPRPLWIPSFGAAWAASAAITATYAPAHAPAHALATPASPPTAPRPPTGPDAATETLDRAARHGDEHVIKFADTAVDIYHRTADPATLAAALHAAIPIDQPT
jgi:hypothetical protein